MKSDYDELLKEALPNEMFQQYLREATVSVEAELAAEDAGWINLSGVSSGGMSDATRIAAVQNSRMYYYTDPMAAQAIRLWTDYTFGPGMTWQMDDEKASDILKSFWGSKANQ